MIRTGGFRCRNNNFQRVQKPCTMTPFIATCVDVQVISQVQHVAGSFDFAAVHITFCKKVCAVVDDGFLADDFDISCVLAIIGTGGVEGAADFYLAFIVSFEENPAFFVLRRVLAWRVPSLLTTVLMTMVPPSAVMAPLLRALASATLPSTVKFSLPSVSGVRVRVSAAAMRTEPPLLLMVPLFSTLAA